ncbi:MAG: EipA family protein [Hyphomicrobium sp.]|nr:EipA family protein [Hyphomicrobium sp.]
MSSFPMSSFPMLANSVSRSFVLAALLGLATPAIAAEGDDAYSPSYGSPAAADTYGDAYRPAPENDPYGSADGYTPEPAYRAPDGRTDSFATPSNPDPSGYGEAYHPPGETAATDPNAGYPDPVGPGESSQTYEQKEIIAAGHQFFGTVNSGIARGIEYVFQSQGRPNGYIVGEDAGGAFLVGLRYGEGTLHTKFAGTHKAFWQGPSLGYDAGAEGSKVMVLVYNLTDPGELFHRFGGVQGSAYFIGGVGVQLQKYGDVTLAVIRSGVGLRLGANVGYMKYTRTPTWNPL